MTWVDGYRGGNSLSVSGKWIPSPFAETHSVSLDWGFTIKYGVVVGILESLFLSTRGNN